MQFAKRLPVFLVLACLLFCSGTMALAAPQVSISSGGNGVFTLQGTGFQGVGGAYITIRYDTATLANPRVVQGNLASGALMAPNITNPGVIILGIIHANGISGSGPLAIITFDRPGSSLGVILSLTADLSDTSGAKIPSLTPRIDNPAGPSPSPSPADEPTTPPQEPGTVQPAPPPAGTAPVLTGGTVTMPGEAGIAGEKPVEQITPEAAVPAGAAPALPETGDVEPPQPVREAPAPPAAKIEHKSVAHKSVLERFRTFQGEKTPKALISLFEQHVMEGISQEPPIVLSDGIASVKLHIQLSPPGREIPNFALKDAKYVSLKKAGENSWVIELLPAKGAYRSTARMHRNGAITEIPLTVAPPIPREAQFGKESALNEAAFILFLKERGTEKAPRFDLNGDGRRDYIDDYIFTANYLFKSSQGKR
ncbi:MAG: cohesin domain-containing protein [Geobacteraceae bacterium]|nr:cohesin domain-containing protein [Geobacteraceae bacterium]